MMYPTASSQYLFPSLATTTEPATSEMTSDENRALTEAEMREITEY
jgi:hypothetical protein